MTTMGQRSEGVSPWAWRLLVAGVVVALCALAWVTWHALRLEQRERQAQEAARFQQNLRLALWRIDSQITPLIAREAARPYFEYQPFYLADQQFGRVAQEQSAGPVESPPALVPSPLLSHADPLVRLHFEVQADGSIISPQAPEGDARATAEAVFTTAYDLSQAQVRLEALRDLMRQPQPDVALSDARPSGRLSAPAPMRTEFSRESGASKAMSFTPPPELSEEDAQPSQPAPVSAQAAAPRAYDDTAKREEAALVSDYQQRKDLALNVQNRTSLARSAEQAEAEPARGRVPAARTAYGQDAVPAGAMVGTPGLPHGLPVGLARGGEGAPDGKAQKIMEPSQPSSDIAPQRQAPLERFVTGQEVQTGEFLASWLRGEELAGVEPALVFVRSVRLRESERRQGFWLDWPLVREQALGSIRDLFPDASLRPVLGSVSAQPPQMLVRMLASVPAELVVAPVPVAGPGWSPLRTALLATWVLVLGASAALVLAVRAANQLAERRGRFVSAVTHELRTPLTTFRLYSQMLAEGMVPDEQARTTYARTLVGESQRLTRIVESVLDYARLGKPREEDQPIEVEELARRLTPSLEAIASAAGMRLDVLGLGEIPPGTRTSAGAARVERVLTNLVENACKYGRGQGPQDQIELRWASGGGWLRISVRDFGPGVPHHEARRIFRAFTRGDAHAHGSTPGMGLGLALSRGLAEQAGGSLELAHASPGAEFVLRVPLVS